MISALDFDGQTILIVGLAREGGAAARWLAERGAAVVVSDTRPAEALAERLAELAGLVELRLGPQTPELLARIDALVVSPGVPEDIPLLAAARAQRLPISSETRLFAQHCPAAIVGVTGSSGKTTTATLTAAMLEAAGWQTWLGGNVGRPLLGALEQMQSEHRVVLELSSFQLPYWAAQAGHADGLTRTGADEAGTYPWQDRRGLSPHIAAVLNITPNHLDRHPSMSHYAAAKAQILASQGAEDVAVLNLDDAITAGWLRERRVSIPAGAGQGAVAFPLAGQTLGFGPDAESFDFSKKSNFLAGGAWSDGESIWWRWQGEQTAILPLRELRLRGAHNLSNVLAACCLAGAAGATPAGMAAAIRSFGGVEHRLQVVSDRDGVLWVDDSIATSPERSLAAVRSFDQPLVLLAGGRDKHLPWEAWAAAVHQRVRLVITFGEAAWLIEEALLAGRRSEAGGQVHARAAVLRGGDLAGAVALARQQARPGEVVLLSPGGTSYDSYEDFAARGRHFCELVMGREQGQDAHGAHGRTQKDLKF